MKTKNNRRGISIVEALFAIGIAVIGLLGAIALVPVGAYHADRSLTADTATRLGQRAQHEFIARGYASPDMWRGYFAGEPLLRRRDGNNTFSRPAGFAPFLPPSTSSKVTYRGFDTFQGAVNANNLWLRTSATLAPGTPEAFWRIPSSVDAFVIDPLFLGTNGVSVSTTFPFYQSPTFPYYGGGMSTTSSGVTIPRMTRLSVAASPSPLPTPTAPLAGFAATISPIQATEIFVSKDGFGADIPDDKSLPPLPQMILDRDVGGTLPVKEQSDGEFSWIATLAPKVGAGNGSSELYLLSIVVFKQRDTSHAMNPINERVIDIRAVSSGSTGTIEVRIEAEQARFTQEYLDVSRGNWVMLQGATASVPYFRWYQVIGTGGDAQPNGTGNWERFVTLQGPEWLPTRYPAATPLVVHGQMVLVDGVVGVYEKTIRLETTSLWRN